MSSDGSSSSEKGALNSLSPSHGEAYLMDLLHLSGGNDYSPYTPGDSGDRTPPLVQGSTLYGEDLVFSSRHSTSSPSHRGLGFPVNSNSQRSKNNTGETNERELLFSPSLRSMQSEATTPPSEAPALSLSPPPLNTHHHHPEARSYASSRGRKSRPPRAPVVNLKFAGGPGTSNWPNLAPSRHVRNGSNGEGSLMSALTESSYEAPPQGSIGGSSQQHSRQLSWDQNLADPIASLDDIEFLANLQQPILNDDKEVNVLRTEMKDGVISLDNLHKLNTDTSHSPVLKQSSLADQLFNREPESFTLFMKQLEERVMNDDMQALKYIMATFPNDSSASGRRDQNKVLSRGRRATCLAGVVRNYVSQSASIAQKVNDSSRGSGTSVSVSGYSNLSTRKLHSRLHSTSSKSGTSKHSHSSVGLNSGEQSSLLGLKQNRSEDHWMVYLGNCGGFFDTMEWNFPLFFAVIALASGPSYSLSSFAFLIVLCGALIITKRMLFRKLVMMAFFYRHYRSLFTVLNRMGLLCELVSMALDGTISPALTPTTSSRSIDSGSETCGSDVISAKAHDKYAGVSRSYPDFPSEIDLAATTEDISAFHRALNVLESEFPFSVGFGLVDSRQSCLDASKAMFERLHSRQDTKCDFIFVNEILAALSWNNGKTDELKKEELLHLLRPDKSGKLSQLDLVTSVDRLYVDWIILRANLNETSLLLSLFDRILTMLFFLSFVACSLCVTSVSLSILMLATAILIASFGKSSFDGILFSLIHRPFSIGDRIIVGKDASTFGNTTRNELFVERIGLFQTKVRHCMHGNIATMANCVLSASHIGCRGRSSQIPISMKIYFPLDVRAEKLDAFRMALEAFVETREHDWTELENCRETGIDASSGLLEYTIDLVSRESWAQSQSTKDKVSGLSQFCRNLQNHLGTNIPLVYRSSNSGAFKSDTQQQDAIQSISFRSNIVFPGERTSSKWET